MIKHLTEKEDRAITMYACKHGCTWLEAYNQVTGLMKYDEGQE